jgi:F420-dependent oxidoreductase-like protein
MTLRISLWIDEAQPLPQIVADTRTAARLGYARVWFGQRTGWDPLTLIAAVGSQVPDIALGTAIVNIWPRHPITLAAQALTAQAATAGRVTLGVGPSHQPLVEGTYGYHWRRPAQRVREYLTALRPLLHGEPVDLHGQTVTAVGTLTTPGAAPPPLLLSAHGPVLLRLAGELADGVITTWTGPDGIERHVVPAVTAAVPAGAAAPQVVVGVVASLTTDPASARDHIAREMALAGQLPSYRRALDRDGYTGPQDTVLAGDETTLERAARRFAAAGTTELQLCPVGPPADRTRTIEYFATLAE